MKGGRVHNLYVMFNAWWKDGKTKVRKLASELHFLTVRKSFLLSPQTVKNQKNINTSLDYL